MNTIKLASRHSCSLNISAQCSKGSGKGPAKCGYCGGSVFILQGVYGVFTWRGDGRYRLEDACATYTVGAAADRKAAGTSDCVVRFITP